MTLHSPGIGSNSDVLAFADDDTGTGRGITLPPDDGLPDGTLGTVIGRFRYRPSPTGIELYSPWLTTCVHHNWLSLIHGAWLDDPSTPLLLDTVRVAQWLRQSRNAAARSLETADDPPSRSPADLIEECLTALGIGKSTLAEILGISRPTLYAWQNNRVETPEARPLTRLQRLAALLREAGITADRPMRRHLVQRPLIGETIALAELLKASQWDEPRLRRLLAAVKDENEAIEAETLRRRNRDRRRAYVDADEGLDTGLTSLEWDSL